MPAQAADTSSVRIASLAATAAVTAAALGAVAPPAQAAGDPLRAVQWALDAIHLGPRATAAASAPTAAGPLVAVLDSGVDAVHPDLAGRVVDGPDLVDGDGVPADEHGHGTHIAGIIAAATGNDVGGAGIAPQARILAIRVLDADNHGTPEGVTAGIDAAIRAGADVVNMSLNWSETHIALAPVTAAMQRAVDAGIAVVVAAGNDARDHCEEPVLPKRALCVGAVDGDLRLAAFSSHGDNLGIVAPGDDVVSTWRGGDYLSLSGTSQAAAVASGVAALLAEAGLRGMEIVERLVRTARDIEAPGIDARTGFGLLDATRAVDGAGARRMPPILSVSSARRARTAALRRDGLRAGCDAARPGRCAIRVRVGGTVVARATTRVDGSGPVTVRVRPTRDGRRLLARTRARSATVEASMRGVPGARRTLTLVRG